MFVDLATAGGSATPADVEEAGGTVRVAPGQMTQTVTVRVIGDALNEALFVNLSNARRATIADDQAVGTIFDDDEPAPPPDDCSCSGYEPQEEPYAACESEGGKAGE